MADLTPLTKKSFEPTRKAAKIPPKPKPPIEVEKKVLVPYLRYSREIWSQYKKFKEDPNSTTLFSDKEYLGEGFSARDMSKYIAEKWNELTPKQRDPYTKAYDRDVKIYTKIMKEWKSSHEYVTWEKNHSDAIKLQKKYDKEYMIASAKYEIDLQNGTIDAQIRARNETISAAKREKTSGGSGGDGNGTAHGATSASVYDIGTVPSEGRELVLHCAKVEASRQVGEVGSLQSADQQKYAHYKVARNRYLRNNCFMEEVFGSTSLEQATKDAELIATDPQSSKQNDALCKLLEESIAQLSATNATAVSEFDDKVTALKRRSRLFDQCIKYRHGTAASDASPRGKRGHDSVCDDSSDSVNLYDVPTLLTRIRGRIATDDTRVHKIPAAQADADDARIDGQKRSRTELAEALNTVMTCNLPQEPPSCVHHLQPRPKVPTVTPGTIPEPNPVATQLATIAQ